MKHKVNFKFWKNNGGWAIEITEAIIAIAALAGAGTSIYSATQTPKAPSLSDVTKPDIGNAEDTAKEQQSAQRRAALAAGGNTNVTGGMGIVLGSDVSSVSLVGSS